MNSRFQGKVLIFAFGLNSILFGSAFALSSGYFNDILNQILSGTSPKQTTNQNTLPKQDTSITPKNNDINPITGLPRDAYNVPTSPIPASAPTSIPIQPTPQAQPTPLQQPQQSQQQPQAAPQTPPSQQGQQQSQNNKCPNVSGLIEDGPFKSAVRKFGIVILAGNYGGELQKAPFMLKDLKDECKCNIKLTSGIRRPSGTHGRGGIWFDMAPDNSLNSFLTSKAEKPTGSPGTVAGCTYKFKGISFLDERNCYFSKERTGPHWHVNGKGWCGGDKKGGQSDSSNPGD